MLRFGAFELDCRAEELRKRGVRIKLTGQPLKVLAELVTRNGQLVTREELRDLLWPPGTFVDFSHSLGVAVQKIREVLDDSADQPRFIETVPRRGYRFIATVEKVVRPDCAERLPATLVQPAHQPPPAIAKSRMWLLVTLGLLLIGSTSWSLWRTLQTEGTIRSLVVLPLANLSGDPAQEYVADGITEELTTDLAQLDTIRVISRASAIHYRNTNKTTPVIGQELRVDAVVEGAVAHLGNRIRITLQLIHAATDRHIWARSFEGDSRDVAALERGIARAVAEQIEARLSRTSRTRFSRAQTTPEAYEAYLKGVYLWNRRTEPDFAKALHYFEEAVRIDPGYAEAYAGISYCYALGYLGLPVRDTISKAKDAAAKALQLDDSLAQAHAAIGLIRHNYDWDFPGAEKEYRRAIQLNPNYAPVYGFYGMELAALGRMDDALAALQRAHEIDPLSLIIATQMGNILYFARQYDRAIEQYRKALDLDPKFEVAHAFLARAYEARGLYVNAAQEYLTAHYATERAGSVVSSPNFDWRVFWQADLQFRLRQRAAGQRIPAFHMAEVSARLGDKGGAFRWLRLSCEERDNRLTLVNVLSTLDNIRSDPRFRDILDCANIKP